MVTIMAQKNSSTKHPESLQVDLVTRIAEHPYFHTLVEHKTWIPYVSIGILVLLFFSFRFFTGKTNRTESNYLLASNYFSMIQQSIEETKPGPRDQALLKLKAITDAYPELHSRYDALIAQLLITENQPKEAQPYSTRTFSRTQKNNLPFYTDFAEITLLVANGDHTQALEKSLALKEQLLAAATKTEASPIIRAFDDTLFAYNLLRIAMLAKEEGSPQEELTAWKEWTKFATSPHSPIDAKAFATLSTPIGEDNFSLQQYIDTRKTELGERSPSDSKSSK